MKKKIFNSYLICWLISVAVFNAVCFITPNATSEFDKFGGAFWSGYVFITLSFLGQLACACFTLSSESRERLFLNLPVLTVSYSALIASLVVGGAAMAVPNVPNWLGALLCVLFLGITAINVIKAKTAADIVHESETNVKIKTFFIKNLAVRAETLMSEHKSDDTVRVFEAVRYSDPVSNDTLAADEAEIGTEFEAFSKCVSDGSDTKAAADELINLIDKRNKKCRMLK